MYLRPTQSTPGGFLLVFFGIFSWAASALAGYASWLVYHKKYVEKIEVEYSLSPLLLTCAIAFLVGLGLIIVGLKMARAVGVYDTHDPDQPSLKF